MDVEFIKSKLKIVREQLQHTFKVPELWDAIEAITSELNTPLDAETLEQLLNEQSSWERTANKLSQNAGRHKTTPAQRVVSKREKAAQRKRRLNRINMRKKRAIK